MNRCRRIPQYFLTRPHGWLAALCGTLLAYLPVSAAQHQDEAAIGRDDNGLPKVGESFQDCPECPLMVRVPSGSFQMGDRMRNRDGPAGPVQEVTLTEPFAVGVYEVTFDEWDACLQAGGCRGHHLDDASWGRGNRPAINLHWDDAQSYVAWLRKRTGKRYRLLTEAEWEYAARAGTATRFGWGDAVGANRANCISCGSRWDGELTAPVGSFPPNAWGLHDMHGNVWELVADCWQKSHVGAPLDGSAGEAGDCSRRVMRGGGWHSAPEQLASSTRSYYAAPKVFSIPPIAKGYYVNVGLRVARALGREVSWDWEHRSRAEIEMALGPGEALDAAGAESSIDLHVPFAVGAADLAPMAALQMKPLAEALSSGNLAEYDFRIIGLTDALDDAEHDWALAQTRAQAVRCRLINTHGFAHSRLLVGEEGDAALGWIRGEVFVSPREYETVTEGQLLPKVTSLQRMKVIAMPNPSKNGCDADVGATCREAQYEKWLKTFGPSPCFSYKDERVKLMHEIRAGVSHGIILSFTDLGWKDLDESNRNFILKITSDAGLSPIESFEAASAREELRWWTFNWPYIAPAREAIFICRLIEGKVDNLLRYCEPNWMFYPDIGTMTREPNKIWLPHLEGPNSERDSDDDPYQGYFQLPFLDYVDEDMLCC